MIENILVDKLSCAFMFNVSLTNYTDYIDQTEVSLSDLFG